MIRINVTSVYVDNQERAHAFYTGTLGFETKHDVPVGDARWLTVTTPGDPNGVELLLEPDEYPAARAYKAALVADGIPFTQLATDDLASEHARLVDKGVRFTQDPLEMGGVTTAVLDDTCGNLIQLIEQRAE